MQITQEKLHLFLSDHLQTKIANIEPVGNGAWSQTYFFSANEQRKVIRFSPYDEDFKKDRFAAQYTSPALPIPQIEEIGEGLDCFFAISSYVDGKMIDQFNAAEMKAAIPALMDLFNALREVNGAQTWGYGGFGADGNATIQSWREFLSMPPHESPESRLYGWRKNLAENKEAEEIYRQGRQRLLDLIPFCPGERHLVHNDLLHFNLILKDTSVAAVIDWGCALWGDFLYDLAMFTTWQFYYPAMEGINFAEEARQYFTPKNVPLPNFNKRLQCYQLHLLLDSLVYNTWKEDHINLEITIERLKWFLGNPV